MSQKRKMKKSKKKIFQLLTGYQLTRAMGKKQMRTTAATTRFEVKTTWTYYNKVSK